MPSDRAPSGVAATQPPDAIGFQAAYAAQPQNVITVALQQNVHHAIISAEEVAALRAADPEAAALLYRMIERQQLHDQGIELETLKSESRYRLFGILAAVAVITAQLAVAALALRFGHPSTAGVLGASAMLTSVAGVFIRGRGLLTGPSASQLRPLPQGGPPEQVIPTHPPAPQRL